VEGELPRGGDYGTVSTLKFGPLETDGLRLEVQLEQELSAGIVEWGVE
jgi:hypothetical protein